MSIRCFDRTGIIRILEGHLSTVTGMADVSFSSIVSLSDPPRQVNLTRTMVGQRAFVFAATTGRTCETPGVHATMKVSLRNLGEGTSVVMAFVGRNFVVLAFAQVYKKKIVVGYQSPCPIKLLVSLLGQKIGVFAVAEILKKEKGLEADSVEHHGVKRCLFCNVLSNVPVCGARVLQDCYLPLDMPFAMDTHVDSMSMRYWVRLVIEKLIPPSGNLHKWVEFLRISLTEFRSCTSRSHYRSVSKQTTRTLYGVLSFVGGVGDGWAWAGVPFNLQSGAWPEMMMSDGGDRGEGVEWGAVGEDYVYKVVGVSRWGLTWVRGEGLWEVSGARCGKGGVEKGGGEGRPGKGWEGCVLGCCAGAWGKGWVQMGIRKERVYKGERLDGGRRGVWERRGGKGNWGAAVGGWEDGRGGGEGAVIISPLSVGEVGDVDKDDEGCRGGEVLGVGVEVVGLGVGYGVEERGWGVVE
ncbi:hypothetical protein Tco_1509058 [Tanacetum coccineum]